MRHNGPCGFVQSQQLPADHFIADASPANLPNSRDGVVIFGEADSMNLDEPNITIILKLKDVT
jgi:hypothetical protein